MKRSSSGAARFALIAAITVILISGIVTIYPREAAAQDPGANLPPMHQTSSFFKCTDDTQILIGLLLPAVQKVREAASRMECQGSSGQTEIWLDLGYPVKRETHRLFVLSFTASPNGGGRFLLSDLSGQPVGAFDTPDGIARIKVQFPRSWEKPPVGSLSSFGDGGSENREYLLPY